MGGISLDLGIILVPILIFLRAPELAIFSHDTGGKFGYAIAISHQPHMPSTAIECVKKNQKLCDIIEQSWEDVQLYDPG